MARTPRSQPYRLNWPFNADQLEKVDQMLQELYDDLRNDTIQVTVSQLTGTLPTTSGGTGTATAFTAGSVVFAGTSGIYAQDNSNLFWDDTTNQLQLGSGSAASPSLSFKSSTALGFYLNGGIVATKDIRVTSVGMLDGSNVYAGAGCYISGASDWVLFQNGAASLTFETTSSIARFSDRILVLGTAANHPAIGSADSVSLRNQSGIYWRNAANSADLSLTVDSSNKFDFTGGAARYPVGYILLTTGGNGIQVSTASVSINIPLLVTSGANTGIGTSTFGTSATSTLAVANGTVPSTSPADEFQCYSKDITAGNAAPHFRTEAGDIVKLYKAGTYTPTNVTTDRSFDANSTTLDELADVVGSLITDLQATGLLG